MRNIALQSANDRMVKLGLDSPTESILDTTLELGDKNRGRAQKSSSSSSDCDNSNFKRAPKKESKVGICEFIVKSSSLFL